MRFDRSQLCQGASFVGELRGCETSFRRFFLCKIGARQLSRRGPPRRQSPRHRRQERSVAGRQHETRSQDRQGSFGRRNLENSELLNRGGASCSPTSNQRRVSDRPRSWSGTAACFISISATSAAGPRSRWPTPISPPTAMLCSPSATEKKRTS